MRTLQVAIGTLAVQPNVRFVVGTPASVTRYGQPFHNVGYRVRDALSIADRDAGVGAVASQATGVGLPYAPIRHPDSVRPKSMYK